MRMKLDAWNCRLTILWLFLFYRLSRLWFAKFKEYFNPSSRLRICKEYNSLCANSLQLHNAFTNHTIYFKLTFYINIRKTCFEGRIRCDVRESTRHRPRSFDLSIKMRTRSMDPLFWLLLKILSCNNLVMSCNIYPMQKLTYNQGLNELHFSLL